jgi:hypothetical protein
MKFICKIHNSKCDDEESTQEIVYNYIDGTDLMEQLGIEPDLHDIMEELEILDTPLYYNLLESAYKQFFEDYFIEEEEEEEEVLIYEM